MLAAVIQGYRPLPENPHRIRLHQKLCVQGSLVGLGIGGVIPAYIAPEIGQ